MGCGNGEEVEAGVPEHEASGSVTEYLDIHAQGAVADVEGAGVIDQREHLEVGPVPLQTYITEVAEVQHFLVFHPVAAGVPVDLDRDDMRRPVARALPEGVTERDLGSVVSNLAHDTGGGIDVEFIYQFGNTRCRRVKSAQDQTDLLFLTKVPVYREFGLGQQYNIYLESCNLWCNTSLKLNYQLLKRNDDRIDVANDRIDSRIANNAESLFDWTAHSLIFMVRHDLWRDYECSSLFPTISAFVKWGFNGKRALLANTAGIEISVAF